MLAYVYLLILWLCPRVAALQLALMSELRSAMDLTCKAAFHVCAELQKGGCDNGQAVIEAFAKMMKQGDTQPVAVRIQTSLTQSYCSLMSMSIIEVRKTFEHMQSTVLLSWHAP